MKKLAILFFCVVISFTSSAFGQANQFDTSFISNDSYLVMILNVKRLLTYKHKDTIKQNISEALKNDLNIDLESLEQLVVQLSGDTKDASLIAKDGPEETLSLIYHFKDKIEKEKVATAFTQKFETVQHGKVEYLRPDRPGNDPCIHFRDDRTMVVAWEKRLKSLIEAENSKSPIVARVRNLSNDTDILIVGHASDTTKGILKEFGPHLKGPINFADLLGQFKSFDVSLNFKDDTPIVMHTKAVDEKGATRITAGYEALIALGQTTMPMMKKSLEVIPTREKEINFFAPPEILYPAGRKGLRILEKFLGNTIVRQDGEKIRMTTKIKGGLPDTPILMGELFDSLKKGF